SNQGEEHRGRPGGSRPDRVPGERPHQEQRQGSDDPSAEANRDDIPAEGMEDHAVGEEDALRPVEPEVGVEIALTSKPAPRDVGVAAFVGRQWYAEERNS